MSKSRQRKAQSTLEYAVLIVLVAIALIATQVYIKRAMQGRLRSAADDIGEQFSPGASRVDTNTHSSSYTYEEVANRVAISRMLGDGERTERNVSTDILNFANEYWAQPPPETPVTPP